MSPFFINFYKGMGLLTAAEQKRFPLERESANDEATLGDNEVARRITLRLHCLRPKTTTEDPSKEAEEQAGDTEVETSSQRRQHSGQPIVYTPLGKDAGEGDNICGGSRKSGKLDLIVRDREGYLAGIEEASSADRFECANLRNSLAAEKDLRASSERDCTSL
ncbi:hypothetical protein AXG93_3104s1110 [Marchantia polymorpha subsp. ruderalis]|uniref:Uncharacterized protein n=1 Tax=Marchantia polymorpha subsp. ruderalis TaxID=1480154 RepID=A0A176WQZ6_MARPO|nr:hypothetical protein AXG93_3104s1110 [Marchantia polymorpha subsp. ruderalis]